MRKEIVISLAVLMASCAPKLIPTDTDVTNVSSKYPGVTLADLKQGKGLYETKCTQCHTAKKPKSQTVEEWKKIVPGMAEGAKKKGKQEISPAEQDLILKYLVAIKER